MRYELQVTYEEDVEHPEDLDLLKEDVECLLCGEYGFFITDQSRNEFGGEQRLPRRSKCCRRLVKRAKRSNS